MPLWDASGRPQGAASIAIADADTGAAAKVGVDAGALQVDADQFAEAVELLKEIRDSMVLLVSVIGD